MLRKATIDDLDEIVSFSRPYFDESILKGTEYSKERSRERFLSYIQDHYTIVFDENGILGMATLILDNFHSDDLICDVEMFYVSPEARGTGVSRLLRDACVNLAKLLGARKIFACSSSGVDDRLWINLFSKSGFKKLGTVMVMEI